MSKFYARMQQRRGTAAEWTAANPILQAGEMVTKQTPSSLRLVTAQTLGVP